MSTTRTRIPCPTDPVLETPRLCVRLAGPADVRAIIDFHARNREHLEPTEPKRPPEFHSPRAWRQRVVAHHREFHDDTSVRMYLFPKEEPKVVIGTAGLTHVVRGPMQACWLGYSLDQRHRGKGLMTEAARAVIDYAFRERNFHRVMAGFLPTNARSARC